MTSEKPRWRKAPAKAPERIEEELKPFNDSRAALVFALNAHQASMPTAFMNKQMAEVRLKAKRKRKALKELYEIEDAAAIKRAERAIERLRSSAGTARVSTPPLRGLQGHHQAGIILFHFARLDRAHQIVLTGLLSKAYLPCECRRPCCSGWTVTERWAKAVREACELLMLKGDVVKAPGRKGLSTQPLLRRLLVEEFFLKNERSLVEMAAHAKVTTVTAARHREWIHAYLADCEQEAWLALDPIFDQAGITGTH